MILFGTKQIPCLILEEHVLQMLMKHLLWCTTSRKAKYTFNYQNLKELNEGKQMRSDWHIPICAGKERLKRDLIINALIQHKNQKLYSTEYY